MGPGSLRGGSAGLAQPFSSFFFEIYSQEHVAVQDTCAHRQLKETFHLYVTCILILSHLKK